MPEPDPSTEVAALAPVPGIGPQPWDGGEVELTYGRAPSSGELARGALCSLWIMGQSGTGKTAEFVFLAKQLPAESRVHVIDPKAHRPDGLCAGLGIGPARVASDPASAARVIADAVAELRRRLQTPGRWPPLVILLDEYTELARLAGPAWQSAAADLVTFLTAGRTVNAHALMGAQVVAGRGSGIPPELRNAAPGRITFRVAGQDVYHSTGLDRRQLGDQDPAVFPRFQALLQLPTLAGAVVIATYPPSADPARLRVEPLPPAVDVERQQLRRLRRLQHVQGEALARIEHAATSLAGLADAAPLRHVLDGAGRAVKRAQDPDQVERIMDVYAPDLVAAEVRGSREQERRRQADLAIEPSYLEAEYEVLDDREEELEPVSVQEWALAQIGRRELPVIGPMLRDLQRQQPRQAVHPSWFRNGALVQLDPSGQWVLYHGRRFDAAVVAPAWW